MSTRASWLDPVLLRGQLFGERANRVVQRVGMSGNVRGHEGLCANLRGLCC